MNIAETVGLSICALAAKRILSLFRKDSKSCFPVIFFFISVYCTTLRKGEGVDEPSSCDHPLSVGSGFGSMISSSRAVASPSGIATVVRARSKKPLSRFRITPPGFEYMLI